MNRGEWAGTTHGYAAPTAGRPLARSAARLGSRFARKREGRIVGGNSLPLDVISITGDLDLNSSIGNSPGATSITVSGDANLGADVETTGTHSSLLIYCF